PSGAWALRCQHRLGFGATAAIALAQPLKLCGFRTVNHQDALITLQIPALEQQWVNDDLVRAALLGAAGSAQAQYGRVRQSLERAAGLWVSEHNTAQRAPIKAAIRP